MNVDEAMRPGRRGLFVAGEWRDSLDDARFTVSESDVRGSFSLSLSLFFAFFPLSLIFSLLHTE